MGIVFPTVVAQKMCRELMTPSEILIYWLLKCMFEISHRYDADLAVIRNTATSIKYLWAEASQLLFTLNVPLSQRTCELVDH